MTANDYLHRVLAKYAARSLANHLGDIAGLKSVLRTWAHSCFIETMDSGSRAKGTAISIASDVDYLVSLTSDCNENSGGLESIFNSLHAQLRSEYGVVRKQNVSVRVNLHGLEVDVTPARKHKGPGSDHWVYLSKSGSRKQTNILRHISDISQSGRQNEIKVLKIWRELHKLDIPSIYLEYLMIQRVLAGKLKSTEALADNVWFALGELAKSEGNPLFARIVDPANSNNVLSDLLTVPEKELIIKQAKASRAQDDWGRVVW